MFFARVFSGGCPPEDPLKRFIKDDSKQKQFNKTEQRENLREFACDKVDYGTSFVNQSSGDLSANVRYGEESKI